MDWTALGLAEPLAAWLEEAYAAQYARDVRLDPFATSMRDFDDVSENLVELSQRGHLTVNDVAQRLTDLRGAGLAVPGGAISDLGEAVLTQWQRFGVATDDIGDELARNLILVLMAHELKSPTYGPFFDYWRELRSSFDPFALIHNWDSLYALNYLDYDRGGFIPGRSYREEGVAPAQITFDLPQWTREVAASPQAIAGADRLNNALGGKIPRGRHRATFCMAMELAGGGEASAAIILPKFGIPKRPRQWQPFSDPQRQNLDDILKAFGLSLGLKSLSFAEPKSSAPVAKPASTPAPDVGPENGDAEASPLFELPKGIDFTSVLVERPVPSSGGGRGGSSSKKTDYKRKAATNEAIGALGEEFALRYEKWRLRDHPLLQSEIVQVSQTDDTLGYDIRSFEVDGTPRYVEVKGTTGPLTGRFYLSSSELAVAEKLGGQYVILRVGNLTSDPRCCEMRFPFEDLVLLPDTYAVTFKPAP